MINGKKLKARLDELEMTQRELSEMTKINEGNISSLINGRKTTVRLTTLETLCKALKCEPSYLMDWE